ncbi:unnamed protein product [Mytilus edulis]|uniref:C1q domain-containing protein n=1 Tax=Mytilus edulis TaxID=6550 RepID=A0A8S3TYX4_MYTED|nr:unnamed protein product [Mytilus edulis]
MKILENEEKTEKRLNRTNIRFASQENKTAEHGKEISELKQLKNIQPLQDLSLIKQQLQSVAAETHSLSVNERARSKDVLAMYNKTINIEETTIHRIGKYQNTTKIKLDQLENRTFANLNKKVQTIQVNLNMSLAQLGQQINDNSRKVSLTSCVSSDNIYSTGTLIKCDDVRTSIGIKNLSALKTSGKFSCEVVGLYHISVHIASYIPQVHSILSIKTTKG